MTFTQAVDLSRELTTAVARLSEVHERVLVGIDGPDCAGKTTFADHLAAALQSPAVPVPALRTSVDDFSRPREQRYERGELSAQGYYLDSFDYPALRDECLLPFLDGDRSLRTNICGHRADVEQTTSHVPIPARAVLIIDGVFLLRPELRALWTLTVYLRVWPDEILRRAQRRDLERFGSAPEVERRYLERYLPGQALYRRRADPEGLANILVDNERPDTPRLERWGVTGVTFPV